MSLTNVYKWLVSMLSEHTPEGRIIIELLDSSDWTEHVEGYFGKGELTVMREGWAYMTRNIPFAPRKFILLSALDRCVIREKAAELANRLKFARRYLLCQELMRTRTTEE